MMKIRISINAEDRYNNALLEIRPYLKVQTFSISTNRENMEGNTFAYF